MNADHHTAPLLKLTPADHARLVRLCGHLTSRPDMAEDLAQETALEAWRQRHKLREPEAQARWLTAVARNVCLRWRQQQGRESGRRASPCQTSEQALNEDADSVDLELDLERRELAGLLDRALALLPPLTRQALVLQYLDDLPRPEIASRMGLSQGALAVRLHRGRLMLRQILLRDPARFGELPLPSGANASWETTRLWCTVCGTRRLLGRMRGNPPVVMLRCPGCDEPDERQMACPVPHPPASLGYGRAVSRVRAHVDGLYGLNRPGGEPRCAGCGRPTPLRVGEPDGLPARMRTPGVHVFLHCAACGSIQHSSLYGVALCLPAGQRWTRAHNRVRSLPHQEIEIEGLPAYHCRFQSLSDGARLDVLIRASNFRLIALLHQTQGV